MTRKLGKGLHEMQGLNALLNDIQQQTTTPLPLYEQGTEESTLSQLDLEQLSPGKYQPRHQIDEADLQELADSIRVQGIIQPIVVRPIGTEHFEIIAGERRWRAAKLAGLTQIPALIRDINDEAAIAMALIENIQRRDLSVLEEAEALSRLLNEFQLTHQEVANAVGKSRAAVTNLLRLLKLNPDVQQFIYAQQLEMGHARALLTLSDTDQLHMAQQIVEQDLSVRATEQLVKQYQHSLISAESNIESDTALQATRSSSSSRQAPDAVLTEWEGWLSEMLELPVTIQLQRSGKGKLTVNYTSHADLEALLLKLQHLSFEEEEDDDDGEEEDDDLDDTLDHTDHWHHEVAADAGHETMTDIETYSAETPSPAWVVDDPLTTQPRDLFADFLTTADAELTDFTFSTDTALIDEPPALETVTDSLEQTNTEWSTDPIEPDDYNEAISASFDELDWKESTTSTRDTDET